MLVLGTLATIGWIRATAPADVSAGPADCGSGAFAMVFCPSLPSFQPEPEAPMRIADQIEPCANATSLRPAFCVVLPSANVPVDHTTLLVRRQDACAQLRPGDAPGFCLAAPSSSTGATLERQAALVLLLQRLGPDFRRVAGGEIDVWAESGVTPDVVARITATLRDDAAAVQAYFGRRFVEVPAVFVFGSQTSFAQALERQFGYAPTVAGQLSGQYGGLLVSGIGAIAINGQNVLSAGRPTIFRHELAHVLTHEIAGSDLPLWLDEGIATLVAEADAADFDVERAKAYSILGDSALRGVTFDEERPWIDRNGALGGNAYGVAREAVRLLVERTGRAGLVSLLEMAGRGTAFASAFATVAGEGPAEFVTRVPDRVLATCRRGISVAATRPDGLLVWRIFGFGAKRAVQMTADGSGHYTFEVQTDMYGTYSGTLGGPMPAGSYTFRASAGIGTDVMTTVVLGTPTTPSLACGS